MKHSKSGFPLPVVNVKMRVYFGERNIANVPPSLKGAGYLWVKVDAEVLMLNINAGTMRVRVLPTEKAILLSDQNDETGQVIDWNITLPHPEDVSAKAFFDQMKIVKS